MKKTYLDHLVESDREFHFRIKAVVPFDDDAMVRIENILMKYELRDISSPEKTIIQEHPLDFQDVQNSEVWMVDAVTGVPVSAYILQQELRTNLKIPEKFLVVRSDNDPLEIETARLNAAKEMEQEAEEKELDRIAMLSTDSVYAEDGDSIDGSEFFGQEYNSKFLDTLSAVSANRQPEYSEPTEGLFNWLANDIEEVGGELITDDFNADIESVKPVPWWENKDTSVAEEVDDKISPEGNFDDENEVIRRNYKDDAGKETKMEKDGVSIRG